MPTVTETPRLPDGYVSGTPADRYVRGHKSLGVAACTAIVVGNMVGSGFYLSPSAMAPYGILAILSWVVMGAGAICLGLTFARLSRLARRPAARTPIREWDLVTSSASSSPGDTGFQSGRRCRRLPSRSQDRSSRSYRRFKAIGPPR